MLGSTDSGPLVNHLFVVAVLALGLNEAAYAAELVRAGIISVDAGQTEAASSLGMSPLLITRRIVLPQAMRVIIPTMGNETISMLKTTSLLAVLGGGIELFGRLQSIYAQTFQIIPLLVVASAWYLIVTSILTVGQARLEAHFGKGFGAEETEAAEKRADRRAERAPGQAREGGPSWLTGHLIDAATAAADAQTGGQPMVKAEQVWKSFGKLDVLKGVDFVVQPQQTFVLLGPSGGGKSTLLRCINHLEKIDAGRLYVAGELMGYRERGKRPARDEGARRGQAARLDRHGVPALQPVPAQDRDRERHGSADDGAARAPQAGGAGGDRPADAGRTRREARHLPGAALAAASSSASPSPGPWP